MTNFERISKIILYVIAAALPLWFIPWPVGVEFGREITFGVLILLAAIFWLLSVLTQGEIRWRHSAILYAAAGLLVIWGAATIFSKSAWLSVFGADPAAERFLTLMFGLILMFLAANIFRTREEAGVAVFLLIFAGAVAGILNILQIFGWSPYQLSIISDKLLFLRGIDFNVVGTINGLAIFFAALFMTSIGLLYHSASAGLRAWVRYALWISPAVFFANLLLIHFRAAWIALLGAGIVLFGLMVSGSENRRKVGLHFDWRMWTTLAILVVSIVMLLASGPIFPFVSIPAEVSPSFSASWRIARSVSEEGPKATLLGSGPGTFGLDWVRYKDPSINQTIFWNVRFNQGSSWFMTIFSTTGLLGLFSWLAFLGISLFLFLRAFLIGGGGKNVFSAGVTLGFTILAVSLFLYPASITPFLLFFLLAGFAQTFLSKEDKGDYGMLDISEKQLRFEAPWAVFLSSLVIIFLLSLGVAGLWMETSRFRTALARSAGAGALNRGNPEEAIRRFERAVSLEQNNFRNQQALLQARTQKIRFLIQRASAGENVQQEFQAEVSRAVDASRVSTLLSPFEPSVWRTQGNLYELMIPFIQGAEGFAFSSYQRASELDPLNPAIYVEWGRAQVAFADRLGLAASQARGEERGQLEQAQFSVLESAERAFGRAIEIKPDYASAHFLAAQAALRRGNARDAIRNTENAKLSAPFDIGVAFQLGLLYYQNDDLNRARAEFERALSFNSNYSNARYFLGLIYSRQGDRERAIEEFERVRAFNPDNEEVRKILSNLRAGKSALSGIAPPPEDRQEPPVR